MGKIIILKKYIILIFSIDFFENRRHVHVSNKAGKEKLCKFWLEEKGKRKITLSKNDGFTIKELNVIEEYIIKNIEYIEEQLDNFYNGKQITTKKINE